MKKAWLFLLLIISMILPLTGCSYNESFIVERSLKRELVNIDLNTFKSKVENSDRFIFFIYDEECYACDMVKMNFLDDFIKKTCLKIYAMPANEFDPVECLYFKDISLMDKYYTLYEKDGVTGLYFKYPTILLIENKQAFKCALGTGEITKNFFDKNVKIDRNVTKYPSDKSELSRINNPSFLLDDNEVSNKIVYYTNSLDNDQIKYYLMPFIEDYQYPIFYVLDETLKTNYLSIVKDNIEANKTSNPSNYLSLIESQFNL